MTTTTAKLGEVCEIVSGATPRRNQPKFWNGDICWITPKDIANITDPLVTTSPERITQAGLDSCSARLLPPGTVLLSSRAPIGHLAIVGAPLTTNQGFKSLIPGERVDSRYLYHWLRHRKQSIIDLGRGATFAEISKEIVANIEIPLPPLPEQKRIAAILDRADGVVRKRYVTTRLPDRLAWACFFRTFGDPSDPKSSWSRDTLDRAVSAVIDCPHSTPRWTESGVVALRTSNLTVGEWNWEDTRYVNESEYNERSKRGALEEGDIVLSREGTVGVAAIVPSGTRMCMGQRLVQIKPDAAILRAETLLYILLYSLDPQRISRLMAGSTSKHLNVGELRKLKVVLPSMQTQLHFEAELAAITRLRNSLNCFARSAADLQSALTHTFFSTSA